MFWRGATPKQVDVPEFSTEYGTFKAHGCSRKVLPPWQVDVLGSSMQPLHIITIGIKTNTARQVIAGIKA